MECRIPFQNHVKYVDEITKTVLESYGNTKVEEIWNELPSTGEKVLAGYVVTEDLGLADKDVRFDKYWRTLIEMVGPIDDKELEKCKRELKPFLPCSINDVPEDKIIEETIIPNFKTFDFNLGKFGEPIPIDNNQRVRVPNAHTLDGFVDHQKAAIVIARAEDELNPVFVGNMMDLLLAQLINAKSKISSISELQWLQWREPFVYLVAWLELVSYNRRKGIYTSPVRISSGRITSFSTDAYFAKRVVVLINYCIFTASFSYFLEKEPLYWAVQCEVAIYMFKDPVVATKNFKQPHSYLMLNVGNVSLDKARDKPPHCVSERFGDSHEHLHLVYPGLKGWNRLSTSVQYYTSELCRGCDMGKKIKLQRDLKYDLVRQAYNDLERLGLKNCLAFARRMDVALYNNFQIMYVIAWVVLLGYGGFMTTNPVLDVGKLVDEAYKSDKDFRERKKTKEEMEIFEQFQKELFQTGRFLAHHCVQNNLIPKSEEFRNSIMNQLTGNSAALGSLTINVDGEDYRLTDKRSWTLVEGGEVFNLTDDDIVTTSFKEWYDMYNKVALADISNITNPTTTKLTPKPLRQSIIGFRNVPGRDVRAIYQESLKYFILGTLTSPYVKLEERRPDKEYVLDRFDNPEDWGNVNMKPNLTNTDDSLSILIQATTLPQYMIVYIDFTGFDTRETNWKVLEPFNNGFREGLNDTHAQWLKDTYFSVNNTPKNYYDATYAHDEHIAGKWYYARKGNFIIEVRVSHLPSGTKATFDKNTKINTKITKLVELKIVEMTQGRIRYFFGNTIAGDDNAFAIDISECTMSDVKTLQQAMNKVAKAINFDINENKSGVSAYCFEMAKIYALLGAVIRVGNTQALQAEKVSQADTIPETLSGMYATECLFHLRYPSKIGELRDAFGVAGAISYKLDTTGKQDTTVVNGRDVLKQRVTFVPSIAVHYAPTAFKGGCGKSFSGFANNETAFFWYSDACELFLMSCAMARAIEFKQLDTVRTKVVDTLKRGLRMEGETDTIQIRLPNGDVSSTGLTRGTEVLRIENKRKRESEAAEQYLLSIGIKVADGLKYKNAVIGHLDQIVTSLRLDKTILLKDNLRTLAAIRVGTKEINEARNEILELQPLLRYVNISISNVRVEKRRNIHRYPTCSQGVFDTFTYVGCRENAQQPKSSSMLAAYRRVLSEANAEQVLYSPSVTEENLFEQVSGAFMKVSKQGSQVKVVKSLLQVFFGRLAKEETLAAGILRALRSYTIPNLPASLTGTPLVYMDITGTNLKRFTNMKPEPGLYLQISYMCLQIFCQRVACGMMPSQIEVNNFHPQKLKLQTIPLFNINRKNTMSERARNPTWFLNYLFN